jgi:hypothetical protein
MSKWLMWVYEPAIDPGGYAEQITVEADTRVEAVAKAGLKMRLLHPDAEGLEVTGVKAEEE